MHVRFAVSGQVQRDHPVVAGQRRQDAAPFLPPAAEFVQQNQRVALPG
jgi:hypothetical protein